NSREMRLTLRGKVSRNQVFAMQVHKMASLQAPSLEIKANIAVEPSLEEAPFPTKPERFSWKKSPSSPRPSAPPRRGRPIWPPQTRLPFGDEVRSWRKRNLRSSGRRE